MKQYTVYEQVTKDLLITHGVFFTKEELDKYLSEVEEEAGKELDNLIVVED